MTGAAMDGVQSHAFSGQANHDFLPGGLKLRSVALPAEPKPWVPLSRGKCLLLAMTLRRAVSKQRGGAGSREPVGS